MQTKVWRVENDQLQLIEPSQLDLEERLENWICDDVSLLSESLLIIGRQVATPDGGALDILAVDVEANLVVIELKREKTARTVVAQTLDYASSIQEFGLEELEDITRSFLKKEFDEAFKSQFGIEVPDTVNERQRMYIVASSFDSTTSRIVEYLSRTYGVAINCVSFSYFKTKQGELILRSTLLNEDDVERRANAKDTKKRSYATETELRNIAYEAGVADLWDIAISGFSPFGKKKRTKTTLYFQTTLDQGLRAFLTIFPSESSSDKGLAVSVVFEHFARGFNIEESEVKKACGEKAEQAFYGSYSTSENSFFLREAELDALIHLAQDSEKD